MLLDAIVQAGPIPRLVPTVVAEAIVVAASLTPNRLRGRVAPPSRAADQVRRSVKRKSGGDRLVPAAVADMVALPESAYRQLRTGTCWLQSLSQPGDNSTWNSGAVAGPGSEAQPQAASQLVAPNTLPIGIALPATVIEHPEPLPRYGHLGHGDGATVMCVRCLKTFADRGNHSLGCVQSPLAAGIVGTIGLVPTIPMVPIASGDRFLLCDIAVQACKRSKVDVVIPSRMYDRLVGSSLFVTCRVPVRLQVLFV